MTSLLRDRTGLLRWVNTGDLLLEEDEEKFFWDLVREPFSSDTSSLAVAFRMLLKEGTVGKTKSDATPRHGSYQINIPCSLQDILKGWFLVGALRCQWFLRVVVV